MGVDRLCFGTSTFVSGRLRPGKDPAPGIAALRSAVSAGVRLVHSNPKLGTQWAIRSALDSARATRIRHLVKAELPLDANAATVRASVMRAVDQSCDTLGVQRLHAVTVEIDLKRTHDHAMLMDSQAVAAFYTAVAREALRYGRVDRVIAYCHSPAHLTAALQAKGLSGVAAQYNVAEPWPALFLDRIEGRGLPFVGMSPLRRGALVRPSGHDESNSARSLPAVRWAAADPRVATIVTTMSSPTHVSQVISALRDPLPLASVRHLATAWLAAASPRPLPEGNGWSPLDRLEPFCLPAQEGPS
ncbi:MAG: hypothetical protein GEV28_16540 [Actinophytocola sp.]|uniref:hypothetical protein n=1 Tax=Actinophytocola sp. TaxID=1872138 RepID=UPI0013216A09|nr:hypothetical protein [Actinophytocola sp.]MPZ81907.1 hypothetical protein [Actinophytocola sp.]